MRKLIRLWRGIQESLWFIPGVLVLLAVVLAAALVELDTRLGPDALKPWPLLFGVGADGSRGMLATIAGSMITVAGTVFSITLVVLALASSQYTSRVLRNFLADRANQTVLGVFVGVFAYCLVVMRTIRGGDEGAFVPSLAVLGGVVLAFVGIGYLIYFIHHISASIQASEILASIAKATTYAIDHLFPDQLGQDTDRTPAGDPADTRPGQWRTVAAERTGYVQEVDEEAILAFAKERHGVVRMERGIGEFVVEGTPLMSVLAANEPDPPDDGQLRGIYAVSRHRTVSQDAAFGIRQIVDVALKALSPGVNDTTTAVMCLDHLAIVLVRLADRRIPSPYRFDDDGELRVLARVPSFHSLVGDSFDQIRQNASANVAVLTRLLEVLELLEGRTGDAERRPVLLRQVRATDEVARRTVPAAIDRQPIEERAAALAERLERGPDERTPVVA